LSSANGLSFVEGVVVQRIASYKSVRLVFEHFALCKADGGLAALLYKQLAVKSAADWCAG
jgi:hypothetical protein